MAKLKVFRTSSGFHDAYVAATSRKAALEAWGSEKDLFAMGAAELVTDPGLTAEPLASPGKVVKLTRGSLPDHLSAAGPPPKRGETKDTQKSKAKPQARKRKPPPPPLPRPSRDDLDAAEAALDRTRSDAETRIAEIDWRIADLRKERERMEKSNRAAIGKAEREADRAKALLRSCPRSLAQGLTDRLALPAVRLGGSTQSVHRRDHDP